MLHSPTLSSPPSLPEDLQTQALSSFSALRLPYSLLCGLVGVPLLLFLLLCSPAFPHPPLSTAWNLRPLNPASPLHRETEA